MTGKTTKKEPKKETAKETAKETVETVVEETPTAPTETPKVAAPKIGELKTIESSPILSEEKDGGYYKIQAANGNSYRIPESEYQTLLGNK